MSKKIPYKVLCEAWAAGTNAMRRKQKALKIPPYEMGMPVAFVNPGDIKSHFLAGIKAASKVLLAWAPKKRQSK